MNILATTAIRPTAPVGTRPAAPTALPDPKPADAAAPGDGKAGGKTGRPSNLLDVNSLLAAQTGKESGKTGAGRELTEEERKIVAEMKARDAEVRRHEEAHARTGGQYAGAPSYQYDQGPDGKKYAVSGEVPIDVSPVAGDPAATIRKMETVKRAALAPAEPSSQDRAVAAKADQEKMQARAEQLQERREETAARNGIDGAADAGAATAPDSAADGSGPGALGLAGPRRPDGGFAVAAGAYAAATAAPDRLVPQRLGLVA